jgi:mono/diheme cytochrome c family protein
MITNERRFSTVSIIVTLLVVTFAPVVGRGAGGQERDPMWIAPADAARRTNPLANQPSAEAGGEKLFKQRCATCHGDDGRGSEKGPNLATADVLAQTDGALFWKISGGNTRGGMPSFSFLPEPQRWQLVLRLRELQPRSEAVTVGDRFADPPVRTARSPTR